MYTNKALLEQTYRPLGNMIVNGVKEVILESFDFFSSNSVQDSEAAAETIAKVKKFPLDPNV